MSIRTGTLLLTTLAGGMLVSAWLIGPAPAATTAPAAREAVRPIAVAKAPPPATVASAIKAARAPVPLLTHGHDTYFDTTAAAASETAVPTVQEASAVPDDPAAGTAAARASVERDGYRSVHGLVKAADGTWHGRAMRGATEIAVAVDASGSVSAE